MPTLRINMTEDEFTELKNISENDDDTILISVDYDLSIIITEIKYYLKFYKKINFTEVYPGYNFNEIVPQLQIGEDGYAKYDIEEVFSGYNYDVKYYKKLNINDHGILKDMVYDSNKDFDLMDIRNKLDNMEMAISEEELYENIGDVTFESWELEQINKSIYHSLDNTIEEEEETGNEMIEEIEDEDNELFKIKDATMTFEING